MDVKNFYMILMTYSINLNHKKRFNAKSFILSNGGAVRNRTGDSILKEKPSRRVENQDRFFDYYQDFRYLATPIAKHWLCYPNNHRA